MKRILYLTFIYCLVSFSTFSQVTYLADTAFTTDIGYDGAGASCLAPHIYYLGWQMGRAQGTWLADAFTVPNDSMWVFDTVIVYGIQLNSGTTSTFLNCNLQIYDGTPGLGGNVIWGDTSTNVLVSSSFTGIYKVDTFASNGGLNGTEYPIMALKLHLSPAPHLATGTYWLSWSAAGSLSAIPFSPDKVLPDRSNPLGQTARQLYGGKWNYIVDSGNLMGMDMVIKASAGLTAGVPTVSNSPYFTLSQNLPNPFSSSTDLSFYVPQACYTRLSVYNTLGQSVATLFDGNADAGDHHVTFDGRLLTPGMYYYRLNTDAGVESKPMLLIR